MSSYLNDHSILVENIFNVLHSDKTTVKSYETIDEEECARVGYGKSNKKLNELILKPDIGLEIGSGLTKSTSKVLFTNSRDKPTGTAYILGDELATLPTTGSQFMLLVIIAPIKGADQTSRVFQEPKNLNSHLSGYMRKNLYDQVRIRIHKKLTSNNFSLYSLSQCIHKAYSEVAEVRNVDTIVISNRPQVINKLLPLIEVANTISRSHKRLKWNTDGVVSCDDLNCNSCDEKQACDTIREVSKSMLTKTDGLKHE